MRSRPTNREREAGEGPRHGVGGEVGERVEHRLLDVRVAVESADFGADVPVVAFRTPEMRRCSYFPITDGPTIYVTPTLQAAAPSQRAHQALTACSSGGRQAVVRRSSGGRQALGHQEVIPSALLALTRWL